MPQLGSCEPAAGEAQALSSGRAFCARNCATAAWYAKWEIIQLSRRRDCDTVGGQRQSCSFAFLARPWDVPTLLPLLVANILGGQSFSPDDSIKRDGEVTPDSIPLADIGSLRP